MSQQPIIRGIQAVGSVSLKYRYNGTDGKLKLNADVMSIGDTATEIATSGGVDVAGFRLDSNFLRANPQIASSFQIPLLGGGALALTNNTRCGQLSVACTRVSTPDSTGKMKSDGGVGPTDSNKSYYDLAFLAQIQQAQPGGDSVGAELQLSFDFNGLTTIILFEGCTVASVDPVGLSGNDAVDYGVVFNYLNWKVSYSTNGSSTKTAFSTVPGSGSGSGSESAS